MKNPDEIHIASHGTCGGGQVQHIEEDVGLVTGVCPKCKTPFVFSYKTNTWISEEIFEKSLQGRTLQAAGSDLV